VTDFHIPKSVWKTPTCVEVGVLCSQTTRDRLPPATGRKHVLQVARQNDMHWAASVVKEDGFVCRKLDLVQAGSCDLFCFYLGMLRVRYWTFDVMFHVVYHPTRCNMNTVLQKKMLDSAETKFSWALVDQKPSLALMYPTSRVLGHSAYGLEPCNIPKSEPWLFSLRQRWCYSSYDYD